MATISSTPALIVVMGCSGCGKSSVGLAVAQALAVPFCDGDDLHPASNVAKMASGNPLNDEDRLPWLHKILKTAKLLTSEEGIAAVGRLAEGTPIPSEPHGETEAALSVIHPGSIHARKGNPSREAVVIGCSALKVAYRDLLRGDGEGVEAYFLYLHGTRLLLLNRMTNRAGHFFKDTMLNSQLATLEVPTGSEKNVGTVRLGKGEKDAEEVGMEGVVEAAVEIARRWLE